MLIRVRAKLRAVFVGFLVLVAGSVTATFVTALAQVADAVLINLAGRQRMLTHEMTKAVLGVAREPASGYRAGLREAAFWFDRTLMALQDGGSATYGDEAVVMTPTTDTATRAQLQVVAGRWGRFRDNIVIVQTAETESVAFAQAVRTVESLSLVIPREMDQAVWLFEAAAEVRVTHLRTIQVAFFASAVGLLIAGYLLTQRTIVNPLYALEKAIQRITGGDLESPVEFMPTASGEIRVLAQSFEGMRHKLSASLLELKRWTANLEERVEHRTQQLAALFEVSSEISAKLEIQRVLDLIVQKTRHLAGGEVAVLCLLDPSEKSLVVAAFGGSGEVLIDRPLEIIRGSAFAATLSDEAMILHEAHDCPVLQPGFWGSHLAVPLRIGERLLGVLCVGHRKRSRFGEEETRLLTLLANSGAVALENARLYEQVERAAARAERERIVTEIHDGLAQTLSYLNLRLGVVEGLIAGRDLSGVPKHLALMQHTVEQASDEVRRLMADLQTSVSSPRTLEGLLRQVVERFVDERGLTIELQVDSGQSVREVPEIHEQVVRVVLEALTNVYKHARPCCARVNLIQNDGRGVVSIQDYGPGFELRSSVEGQYHFGLKVMKTRAEQIGGELHVESAMGEGTTVTLRWPVVEQ